MHSHGKTAGGSSIHVILYIVEILDLMHASKPDFTEGF